MRAGWIAVALLAAAGCDMFEPQLPELREGPRTVEATEEFRVSTGAWSPTDVLAGEDGGFAVIDGYQGRALLFDAQHQSAGAVGDPMSWGTPVRGASAADAGWWLTVPEADRVLKVATDGEVQSALELTWPDGSGATGPVAVHDLGESLVVTLRTGEIVWADPATGVISTSLAEDTDGVPFAAPASLEPGPDGTLWVADPMGPKVHQIDRSGQALGWIGHFGLWEGYLSKPKVAAAGPDGTVLVADTVLDVIEVFDADGTALGAIALDGELQRMAHVLALEQVDADSWLALDASTGEVWGFSVSEQAVREARADAKRYRYLRYPLHEGDVTAEIEDGTLCFECHDGLVEDDRYVWDPDLGHHPVQVEPEGEVPAFFPLSESGNLVCSTCHSPHGVATLAEVRDVDQPAQREALVRHAPGDDFFLRVEKGEAQLCVGCHEDAAHEEVLTKLGLEGTTHPVGSELHDALAEREGAEGIANLPEGVDESCLGCHAPHGATGEEALTRDAVQGQVCVSCHPGQARRGANHPIEERVGADATVQADALPLTHAGENTCRTCHDLVGGRGEAILRIPQQGGQLCAVCHDPAKARGPHGDVRGEHTISCLGCHDVHEAGLEQQLLATLSAATEIDPQGCLSCHGEGGSEARRGELPGTHGHPVGATDVETCSSCHVDAHEPLEGMPTCGECHEEQQAAAERGGHGGEDVTCQDCHEVHAEPAAYAGPALSEDLNPASRRCLTCHAPGTEPDGPKVGAYDHPAPVFKPDGSRWTPLGVLPLFGPEGEELPRGENGDLSCQSCHLVHGPDAGQPKDKLRIPEWQEACAACHGGDALPLYRYFHRPETLKEQGITP